jgi:hypothetical protein
VMLREQDYWLAAKGKDQGARYQLRLHSSFSWVLLYFSKSGTEYTFVADCVDPMV